MMDTEKRTCCLPQRLVAPMLFGLFVLLVFSTAFGTTLDLKFAPWSVNEPVQNVPSLEDFLQNPASSTPLVFFKSGRWQEADQLAKETLTNNPDDLDAHGTHGVILAQNGLIEEAQVELGIIKETGKSPFYEQLIEGIVLIKQNKPLAAKEVISKVLDQDRENPVPLFWAGVVEMSLGNLQDAEHYFQKAVANRSDFSPALMGLSQVCLLQDQEKEAEQYLKAAILLEPSNIGNRKKLHDFYRANGNLQMANKVLKDSLYQITGMKEHLLKRAMQLQIEGAYEGAIQLVTKALEAYGNVPGAYYVLAIAQANLGQSKEAAESIETFLAHNHPSAIGCFYAGMCYFALNRFDEAKIQFTRAVTLPPHSGRHFIPLTILEQQYGNYDSALEGLDIARRQGEPQQLIAFLKAHIFLAKGDIDSYRENLAHSKGLIPGVESSQCIPAKGNRQSYANNHNRLMLYFHNGWYGKTIELGERILSRYSEDILVSHVVALAQVAQKKGSAAKMSYKQILRLAPDDLSALMGLAQILLSETKVKQAEAIFMKILQKNETFAPAYLALGDIMVLRNNTSAAVAHFLKAATHAPDSCRAYQRLAKIKVRETDGLSEAMGYGLKAVEADPGDPKSLDILGWIYVKQGAIDKAIPLLTKSAHLNPTEPTTNFHLGVAYFQNNQENEAKLYLENALRISDNFEEVDQAKELLKKI